MTGDLEELLDSAPATIAGRLVDQFIEADTLPVEDTAGRRGRVVSRLRWRLQTGERLVWQRDTLTDTFRRVPA